MEYLIDTHILLWYLDGNIALPEEIANLLDSSKRIIVSTVSLWELTIKASLNKIELSNSLEQIQQELDSNRKFEILNISFAHLNTLSGLPHYHRDPFDRLLIAQAISENLTIISADRHFKAYPVQVTW
jgi:PIN domain nuclease of toxin-antitoxin system